MGHKKREPKIWNGWTQKIKTHQKRNLSFSDILSKLSKILGKKTSNKILEIDDSSLLKMLKIKDFS